MSTDRYNISATSEVLTVQGVVGKRKGCVTDTSFVVREVSGLVIIFVVIGSVVTMMEVGSDAVIVKTVEVSAGVVLSIAMVVSAEVGRGVVMVLVVVSGTDVMGAVMMAVVGGGCAEGEVGGRGVKVAGDGVDSVVVVVGAVEGEAGVVAETGEVVTVATTVVTPVGTVGCVGILSVVLTVSGCVEGVTMAETKGGAVGEGDGVREVVTGSVAVVLEVTGVVVDVVSLRGVEEAVGPLVVAAVVVVVEGLVVGVAIGEDIVGAVVVLWDRVTYAKGVGVGGRDTPSGYDLY